MLKISLSSFALVFSFVVFFLYNYLFFFNIDFSKSTLYIRLLWSLVFLANNLLNSFLIFCYLYFLCRSKKFFLILFPILLFLVIAIMAINSITNFETTSFLIHDIIDNTVALHTGLFKLYKTEIIKGVIIYFVILFFSLKIIDFRVRKKFKLKNFTLWLVFICFVSYALFYFTITFKKPYTKDTLRKSNLLTQYASYSQNAFTFAVLLNFKSQKQRLSKKRKAFLKHKVISHYSQLYNEANFYSPDQTPRLLIITVGESVNASHLSLNGYRRKKDKYFISNNTTPNLQKIKSKIVSFKKNSSCTTLTSMEWPCMFFPYTRHDFKNYNDIYFLEDHLPDIFTILAQQGYKVYLINYESSLWEQSIRKIRARIKLQSPKYGDTNLNFACNKIKDDKRATCQLKNTVKFIEAHKSEKVAIFTYGTGGHSHYSYFLHSQYVTKKHPEKINRRVNRYDGTIMFLDSYLYKLINYLEKEQKNSMMLYISDHGEAVDQGGQHGQNYKLAKQKYKDVLNPATIVWFSPSWQTNIDKNALKKANYYRNNTYKHARLFEGILKCAGIENKNYIYQRNIC